MDPAPHLSTASAILVTCDMGGEEITAFLNHLDSQRNVAASTQNQALNAILFLYPACVESHSTGSS